MLQLVVEIHNTQASILPVRSQIESSQSRRQAEACRTFYELLESGDGLVTELVQPIRYELTPRETFAFHFSDSKISSCWQSRS